MKNFVVSAYRMVGKTTLAKRLIESTDKKIYGFATSRIKDAKNEHGLSPVYIYPAGGELVMDEKHLVGYCGGGQHYTNAEVFDTLGAEYLKAEKGGLIIMDEVGFIEADAKIFQEKIFEALDSDIPVVLFLKQRDNIELIDRVRAYPNKEYFEMNEGNREEIFEYISNCIAKL